jgi:hypothetical protein
MEKDEYPVRVGAMLFTMVDPNRGHEVAYNRWYEHDHFYGGCMIGPGMLSGARWVATRPLKDLRFPADSQFAEPVDAGSYLAIYWVNGGQEEEWLDWSSKQVWWLYENGRGFAERTHAQTGIYDFQSSIASKDHAVSITLALNHRYPSMLVVVVEPAEGTTSENLIGALEDGPLAGLLASIGDARASSWTVRRRPGDGADKGSSPMPLGASGGSPDRVVQLIFSENGPTDDWDAVRAYAAAIESAGLGRVTFASPFMPTDFGTDRYTDELW